MEFVQVWKWSKLVYKTVKYKHEFDQEQERSTVTLINKLVELCRKFLMCSTTGPWQTDSIEGGLRGKIVDYNVKH